MINIVLDILVIPVSVAVGPADKLCSCTCTAQALLDQIDAVREIFTLAVFTTAWTRVVGADGCTGSRALSRRYGYVAAELGYCSENILKAVDNVLTHLIYSRTQWASFSV